MEKDPRDMFRQQDTSVGFAGEGPSDTGVTAHEG